MATNGRRHQAAENINIGRQSTEDVVKRMKSSGWKHKHRTTTNRGCCQADEVKQMKAVGSNAWKTKTINSRNLDNGG